MKKQDSVLSLNLLTKDLQDTILKCVKESGNIIIAGPSADRNTLVLNEISQLTTSYFSDEEFMFVRPDKLEKYRNNLIQFEQSGLESISQAMTLAMRIASGFSGMDRRRFFCDGIESAEDLITFLKWADMGYSGHIATMKTIDFDKVIKSINTPRVDYRDKIDMIILVEADAVRITKSKEAAL